jgi:hypothetical protein
MAQTAFVVTATDTITNSDYRLSVQEGFEARGSETVVTVISEVTPIDPIQSDKIVITATFDLDVTLGITIEIPADAVDQPLNLGHAFIISPHPPIESSGLYFVAPLIVLDAYQGTGLLPNYMLNRPITITVRYSDTNVVDENKLGLYYFDQVGGEWTPKATCSEEDAFWRQDVEANILQVTACKLGQFSLFDDPPKVYLPLVLKATS